MDVPGFKRFSVTEGDGETSFHGTAKVLGQIYFFSLAVVNNRVSRYRFETFTGKNVWGAANVKLEGLMDVARKHALKYTMDGAS